MNHEREQSHANSPAAATIHNDTVEPGQASRSALLRKPDHAIASGLVQRKARDANGVADGAEHAISAASSSSGSPLPDTLMRKFETSLGFDLSEVRVHTGGASEQAADAVGAKAYTIGNDIHFGAGHYDPSSSGGQHLLAHEVAHTVQQSGGAQRMQFKLEVSSPGDSLEHEADRAADAMVSGGSAIVSGAAGLSRYPLQRRAATEQEAAEIERLDTAENTAYANFQKLSGTAQAWDYFASSSGPTRQAAFAKWARTKLTAAITRAHEGEQVDLVSSMGTLDMPGGPVHQYAEYMTASERGLAEQLKVGAEIAGGPTGAIGYMWRGDEGAHHGAIGDQLLSCFTTHPLNSQEVHNAPRTDSYVHGAPTHESTSRRSTPSSNIASKGTPSVGQRGSELAVKHGPEADSSQRLDIESHMNARVDPKIEQVPGLESSGPQTGPHDPATDSSHRLDIESHMNATVDPEIKRLRGLESQGLQTREQVEAGKFRRGQDKAFESTRHAKPPGPSPKAKVPNREAQAEITFNDTQARKQLRANMGPSPEGHQGHHIVPFELRDLPLVQEMTVDTGWDINGIGNGIDLPVSATVPGAGKKSIHCGSHPTYSAMVKQRLGEIHDAGGSPAQKRAKLDGLIEKLSSGLKNGDIVLK